MSYNKPEHVQTSKPRVNAIIIITIGILADSPVSQQWLSIAQHKKIFITINPITFIMQYKG